MLRAYGVSSSSKPQYVDLSQLHAQRKQQLEARRQRSSDVAAASAARTQLVAEALGGTWAHVPKGARADFERFMRAVSRLLGGESGSEEVAETALVVWQELSRRGGDTSGDTGGGGTRGSVAQQRVQQAAKQALEGRLGPLEAAVVPEVLELHGALQRWRSQLRGDTGESSASAAGGSSSSSAPPAAGPSGAASALGAKRPIMPGAPPSPAAAATSSAPRMLNEDEAVLAMCGMDPSTSLELLLRWDTVHQGWTIACMGWHHQRPANCCLDPAKHAWGDIMHLDDFLPGPGPGPLPGILPLHPAHRPAQLQAAP
jgi:hypothetical protein